MQRVSGEALHEEIRYVVGQTTLGPVLVACGDRGVVAILTGESREGVMESLHESFPHAHVVAGDRECREILAQVIQAVESPGAPLELELDLRGTDFQKKVWRAVQKVPLGQTSTYSEIAERIGAPKAMRAVGSSCSRSCFSIAVPCHRILRKGGSPAGGDFWGDERLRVLLERERAAVSGQNISKRSPKKGKV